MKRTNITKEKRTGATFTPPLLSDYLACKIIGYIDNFDDKVVLDPACGDGSLLISMLRNTRGSIGKIVGYDTNTEYIEQIIDNLKKQDANDYKIENQDFLEISANNMDLFSENSINPYADVVIANPPYVRTQILGAEKSKQIAKKFNLSGKVDLYYPFLIGMTNMLKEGGILGVITSNRYITTKSGSDIRKFLLDNYEILQIIDLGDTKLFNAAVLPAILIARKKINKKQLHTSCKFAKLYEKHFFSSKVKEVGSVYDILFNECDGDYKVGSKIYNYTTGTITFGSDKSDVWKMTTDNDDMFIECINKNTYCYIGDKFKVRVGIKSCADNVFLNANWDNDVLVEKELFRPLISRENIQRWHCSASNLSKVLYPHYEEDGKRLVYDIDKYPKVKEYLISHRDQLEGRSYLISSGRKWYEMWVPQNPKLWRYPKVVFPDISVDAKFSYDNSGAIVNGNCYWIVAQTEYENNLLFLIQGVANSDMMSRYHDLCFNNKLYSGRKRYLSQYIERYPIPNPDSVYSIKIIEIVKKLNVKNNSLNDYSLIEELNDNVNKAFGIMD